MSTDFLYILQFSR